MTLPPLLPLVSKRDGRVAVKEKASGKTVRLYPVDVREQFERGAIDVAGFEQDPEPKPLDFDGLSLEQLKQLYTKALNSGAEVPVPDGRWGKRKYAEVLQASGWQPRG